MRGKKVLAPTERSGNVCQYTLNKRRGGTELVMECGGCNGLSSLDETTCYGGVLRAIKSEGAPISLILRSHVERRYDPKPTILMNLIAEIAGKIEILHGQLVQTSQLNQGTCNDCSSGLVDGLKNIVRDINSMDIENAISSSMKLGGYDFKTLNNSCHDCQGMTRMQLSNISERAISLEKALVMGTFNLVVVE